MLMPSTEGNGRRVTRRSVARRRGIAAVCALGLAQGCYTTVPSTTAPRPGSPLAITLTDRGRVELADRLGPGVVQIDGLLVDDTGSEYVIGVDAVKSVQGGTAHWTGERVSVNHDYVANVMEKRFSRGRTILLTTVTVVALTTLILTRNLLGFGSEGAGRPTQGGGTQQ